MSVQSFLGENPWQVRHDCICERIWRQHPKICLPCDQHHLSDHRGQSGWWASWACPGVFLLSMLPSFDRSFMRQWERNPVIWFLFYSNTYHITLFKVAFSSFLEIRTVYFFSTLQLNVKLNLFFKMIRQLRWLRKAYLILYFIHNSIVLKEIKTENNFHSIIILLWLQVGSSKKQSFIFCSPDVQQKSKIVVMIHGAGVVRAGQWARRLIINEVSCERVIYLKNVMILSL